jgi:POT family proton-dependent oligopeptide transporter
MLGLFFIAAGTGLLKPNISALVGSLYPAGDKRRDGGFTIFYMGVNLGAVLAGLVIGTIGESYGWHYGFGLAGIGMLLGISILLLGKQYLVGVGDPIKVRSSAHATKGQKLGRSHLSKEEKDRFIALIVSFIAIISFFVAFEQAGGLMNLYTEQYTDRYVFGKEIPASAFQSLNPFFVILLGPVVAIFWNYLNKKCSHISTFFKLGIGNIIIGVGFLCMVGAALQLQQPGVTQSSLHWIVSAYLFHTIGELCISPVSLSFVTKLAPERIGSSIMGIYFAVVGLGNYFAAWLGKQSAHMGDLSVFQLIFWTSVTIGCLFILCSKRLSQLSHNAE